jgi:hypothetical protein
LRETDSRAVGIAQSTEAKNGELAWLYMSLGTAIFVAFSAALWLVIKHADIGPAAGAAEPVPTHDRSTEVPVLSGQHM